MASPGPALSMGTGYGIVLGLGFAFALGMILTTWFLKRYNAEKLTSESFATANRSVKSGLIASSVVSSWTWAATLLQSTSVAYRYGVSGPFWYASGATVQILLFATIAIELKRRAPNAHTFLEVIRARYGAKTHLVYVVFAIMTNILVTAMLLTGGAAVVNALTGMPTAAACFLLPLGVVLYTVFGGLKATFLTDYVHTFMLLIIIIVFALTAYGTSSELGSASRVYELLTQVAMDHPVDGNEDGSYLTMRSMQGAIFFVINIAGNFGTVFMDQGYYQKAIAASPVDALPGYILGGLSWFAVPWLTSTTMGLTALALESNPSFPTYPNRISDADVSAGLVLPYAAVALLGSGGAIATLLIVFMAVTSASSSEFIAVSSIATYDVYQTYINPKASGKRLIYISHVAVVLYAIVLAGFSVGLYYIGISLGYIYLMMGVIISAAVLPAALSLTWSGQNTIAATLTPILGLACSLTAWLVTAKTQGGVLTVATTGANYPMLAGNVVALCSPIIFIPVLTYAFGTQNYDWQSMKAIRLGDDDEKPDLESASSSTTQEHTDAASMDRAAKISRTLTLFMTFALLVLWPMPMYGTGYIFSEKFFTGWVVVGVIWIFGSLGMVGLFPLWEGRYGMLHVFRGVWRDVTGKGLERRSVLEGTSEERDAGGESLMVGKGEVVKEEEVEVSEKE